MTAVGFDQRRRLRLVQRMGQDRRVAQQHIELDQDEFGNRHIIPTAGEADEIEGFEMVRAGPVHRVEQEVGVDRQHGAWGGAYRS